MTKIKIRYLMNLLINFFTLFKGENIFRQISAANNKNIKILILQHSLRSL